MGYSGNISEATDLAGPMPSGVQLADSQIVFYHENVHESFALIHSMSPMPRKTAKTEMDAPTRGPAVTLSVSNQNSKQEDGLVVSLLSEGAYGREETLSDMRQGRRNFLEQDSLETLHAKFTALRIAGLNDSV